MRGSIVTVTSIKTGNLVNIPTLNESSHTTSLRPSTYQQNKTQQTFLKDHLLFCFSPPHIMFDRTIVTHINMGT